MIRKIISEEERQRKESKNKIIISVVLAVIMLFSTAGYFVFDFSSSNSGSMKAVDIGGTKFTPTASGTWKFSYGGYSYETLFNPSGTANISNENILNKVSSYYGQPLYISGDPIEDLSNVGSQEIIKNLGQLASRVNYACLSENCSQNYPIKNCSENNIIIFKRSATNYSAISEKEKCEVISYHRGEEEKSVDAFLFKIMGI